MKVRPLIVVIVVALGSAGLAFPASAQKGPIAAPVLAVELSAHVPNDGPSCYLVRQAGGPIDVSVGSVLRALLEAVSKEHGLLYAKLKQIYESSFVSNAMGEDGELSLVLTLLEGTDVKSVLAQVEVEIGPTPAPGRPDVKAEPRDPQEHEQPNVDVCEETVLAGSKDKSRSDSSVKTD